MSECVHHISRNLENPAALVAEHSNNQEQAFNP